MSEVRRFLGDARLVAARDLRIEFRSRVVVGQVVPFALLVLVLFGFALDADHRTLRTFASGLFWVAVLLSALLAVHRSAALEQSDGTLDALRMSGLPPAALFIGKATAVFVQLVVLEVVLLGGLLVLYGVQVVDPALLVLSMGGGWCLAMTCSPFGAGALVLSRATGLSAAKLTWGWNLPYTGLAALLLAGWLALLNELV